jgi:hypothetical protein
MIVPNPLALYAAIGALAVGTAAGWTVRDWKCDAAQADALERAVEQRQEMQDEVDTQAGSYEVARAETYGVGAATERQVRVIYRELPAPSVDCAPPTTAVGLLQDRVDHANASASGELGE